MAKKTKPTHDAFVVNKPEGSTDPRDSVWMKIGAAWPHEDGQGFNIVLSALPVGGKLVLRTPKEKEGA